jgi:hypothetical protein
MNVLKVRTPSTCPGIDTFCVWKENQGYQPHATV